VRNEISAKNWCSAYPHVWGNELYNRSVSISNPFFEKLFLPVMTNLTEGDRERGSRFIVMSLKAQINALKIMMNTDYLVFMNITLYNEVIKKYISPQCSQYVLVALTRGGMVYSNKLLWEFLIGKREFLLNQEINATKQKQQAEAARLQKLQKPAGQQVDERVDERVTQKMTSAVPETVQSILKETLNPEAFKNTGSKHKKKHGSRNGNKKHKLGSKQESVQQPTPNAVSISSQNMAAQPLAMNTNTIMAPQPMLSVPSGFGTPGQNIQFVAIPANQLPQFTFSEFRGGGNFHRGFAGGSFRGRRGRFGSGRNFTKTQGEMDAYCMDVAPFNIFENQIIPVGLHNLSKSFRPNLTTTRVFSLGTKFIPVWRQMKVQKPFANFEDFRRKMSNKVYFTKTTPGTFVRNKNFHIKNNWWANEQYN